MEGPRTGKASKGSRPPPTEAASSNGNSAERDGAVGTLARGLRLLDALATAPQPLGLADVAGLVGLEQSTALRLLRALEENRYVLRDDKTRKYKLSPKALRPLPLLHPLEQLRREIAAPLRDLALRVNKTVLLALYVGSERMVVDLAQGINTINAYYDTWLTGPLHATAAGKAYLMGLDSERRRATLGPEPLARFTPATLTMNAELDANLDAAGQRGFVIAQGESRQGIGALAVNVYTWQRVPVGCLVATGHAGDFSGPGLADFGAAMRLAADLILLQAPSLVAAAQFCGL